MDELDAWKNFVDATRDERLAASLAKVSEHAAERARNAHYDAISRLHDARARLEKLAHKQAFLLPPRKHVSTDEMSRRGDKDPR